MVNRRSWLDALGAGAVAGLVAEAMVLRMNPEATQVLRGVVLGMPLWASWGMLMLGLPLVVLLAVLEKLAPRRDRWLAPLLNTGVFGLAAVLAAVNAKFHIHLLRGSAHRVLVQDAVAWSVAALLAVGGGMLIRRLGSTPRQRTAYVLVMLALPVMRIVWAPTPERQLLQVTPQPLGTAARPLLVIGLEGLDSKFLLSDSIASSSTALARLREDAGRIRIQPHRPYLRWALWTSVATGTYPGRHGVKAHWGWDLPLVFGETLRLLPWTPEGSRMILPWWLAERVPPPPATVAPLWGRLRASSTTTEVFGWPGSWGEDPSVVASVDPGGDAALDPSMRSSLDAALAPFPDRREEIWSAIRRDQWRVDGAVGALRDGTGAVWIHLESLALTRRYHQPLRPRHTLERQLMELVTELVDDQLRNLIDAAPGTALVAVVSPYGLAPPGPFERFKRLLGGGDSWHTSAESCPDGMLALLGRGVEPGQRAVTAAPPDVAPTLCYLLGLPVAQYMEGGIVVELVTQEYLSTHLLRVVE